MRDIKFLDCTLRDGGHVVSAKFMHDCIVDVVTTLASANIDIIEFGFLKQLDTYEPDTINYTKIEDAYTILDEAESREDYIIKKEKPIYALMVRADEYDINRLSSCNGKIELIRIAFYYDFLEGGIEFAKKVTQLGYMCSLNLINTPGSTMEELEIFIDRVNEIKPYAVSIVDTFGILTMDELRKILEMYDNRLNEEITIGLHVHENLSLSFALAQTFLQSVNVDRHVIIDGSLMGIGRAPGNLCTELITDYLNKKFGKDIVLNKLMSAINKDIKPFKQNYKWGYAPEFFLSAKYRVHRSYAEYLEEKQIDLESIDEILSLIDVEHSKKYSKDYIDTILKEKKKYESFNYD